jgi:hypothetical protein
MKTLFPHPTSVKIDDAGHIDEDTTCVRCGYNLRGLSVDGICPECGTAVGRSLQGDLLRFAPPEWVEKLASGMNWILAGIVIGIFAAVLSVAAGMGRGRGGPGDYILHLLGIVGVIGYWRVATPDPARIGTEPAISARSLVRFVTVFGYVVGFVQLGASRLNPSLMFAALGATSLIGIVGFFADFIYARQLALRIPNHRLAAHARIVMWGLIASMGFMVISGIVGVLSVAGGSWGGGAAGLVMCPPMIGMLVFAIWAIVLLIWFRRELSDAALLARRTWAASADPSLPVTPARFPTHSLLGR